MLYNDRALLVCGIKFDWGSSEQQIWTPKWPTYFFPNPMQKRGSWMCLWRQIGHLPGLVSRSLFLNLNPHFLHSAGIVIRRSLFFWVAIRICPRWSTTSFSEIPISADISRADKIRSVRTEIISWRIVSCFSGETKGSLGLIFIYVTKSWPNLSKQAGICDQVQPSAQPIFPLISLFGS